ncbi:MAG: RluA family pseudouridine synthase [Ruminococcaceae bacterium]|nr:RluA family pseudouridine synthase [Oscillospiraceae bacterium]
MEILFEDRHIICIKKPVGMLSQQGADTVGMDDITAVLTARERENGVAEPYIGVVHRLDAGVGGVMVYAKKPYAAAALSETIRGRDFVKEYLCVVSGTPAEMTGEYRDLLWKDARANKVYAVDRTRSGVKEAQLSYRVLQTVTQGDDTYSLLRVTLGTGRSHQIRCQLSHHGTPIVCDGKYGGHRPDTVDAAGIALWSYHLSFTHPANMPTPAHKNSGPMTARMKKRQEKKPVFANPDLICLPDVTAAPWSWFDVFGNGLL